MRIEPDSYFQKYTLVEFGQSVAYMRRKQKWTQQRLATNTSLSRTYIALLEKGKVNPSYAVMESVAYALGMQLADLIPRD